jgi:hypothetical protein
MPINEAYMQTSHCFASRWKEGHVVISMFCVFLSAPDDEAIPYDEMVRVFSSGVVKQVKYCMED